MLATSPASCAACFSPFLPTAKTATTSPKRLRCPWRVPRGWRGSLGLRRALSCPPHPLGKRADGVPFGGCANPVTSARTQHPRPDGTSSNPTPRERIRPGRRGASEPFRRVWAGAPPPAVDERVAEPQGFGAPRQWASRRGGEGGLLAAGHAGPEYALLQGHGARLRREAFFTALPPFSKNYVIYTQLLPAPPENTSMRAAVRSAAAQPRS